MNTDITPQPGRSENDTLRDGLHETSITFNYDELLQGTRARATRIRRRRAAVAAGAALVLFPAAIGAATVLPDIWAAPSVLPAGQDGVPWQDGDLPDPSEGDLGEGGGNNWDIPDARPTGVAVIEDFGQPRRASNSPRTPVLDLVMTCDVGNPGRLSPEGGQLWEYGDIGATESVSISVTGWADSPGAMSAVANDTDALSCVWDDGYAPGTWDGQKDSADHYLNEPYQDADAWVSAAAVRQGDYIVGVTVRNPDPDVAQDAAQEIADKTAGNLEVLDPAHGRD